MDIPSLFMIPSAVSSGKVHSVFPNSTDADFDFARSSTASRVNSDGLIETVASGQARLNYEIEGGLVNTKPSLLLEPQSTNLEEKGNGFSTWSSNSNITRTADYIISPDGTQNATRLQFTANGFCSNKTQSLATYTMSCYAKRNDSGTQNVGFFTNGSGVVNSAWEITSEWKRFSYSFPALNAGAMGIAGASGADISVYGFQLEGLSSYATSYIPTNGSTQTRAAETCNGAGTSSIFESSEGILYAEISALADDFATYRFISLYDGTFDNFCDIYYGDASNRISVRFRGGGGSVINMFFAVSDVKLFNKVAISWKLNKFKFFINGVSRGLNTSGAAPVGLSRLDFNQTSGSNPFYGQCRDIRVYNTKEMTDSEVDILLTKITS